MDTLGGRIDALRKNLNLTIQKLADKCNISKGYMGDIIRNRTNPSLDTLKSISKALDTTVSYLLGENDEPKTKTITKAYHNLNAEGLSEEDIKKVEEYIELLKQKYNPDGTLKKK